jgi:anti-sigma regulatory factor (Ser/Thr protein kinase)
MAAHQQKATCMHEYTRIPDVWNLTCPGTPDQIHHVRRWTRTLLRDCPCLDEAVVIVSELGTNAIKHTASGQAEGTFRVTLRAIVKSCGLGVV